MMFKRKRKKKKEKLEFKKALDIKRETTLLIKNLKFAHIRPSQIFCVRSHGSRARAYARIWGLSRIFQEAVGYKPTYVIEVISERFDRLSSEQKTKVLIHELMHIPMTFSGALKQHKGRYHRINSREVEKLYKKLE
ncbi:MAG: putative metallopeptidase [Candidatus Paceibacterota bacterium]